MCQTFVENCCEDDQQMLMIYYWMLDICECYQEMQTKKISKKFKTCLNLGNDKALLVEALWLLDHKLYKVKEYTFHFLKKNLVLFFTISIILYNRFYFKLNSNEILKDSETFHATPFFFIRTL